MNSPAALGAAADALPGGASPAAHAAPPRLSVITPTFNRAGLLPACVESVRGSGVPDYEHVVIDDGSTDNTAAVAASLGPTVRYLRQDNAGPSDARNHGFRLSRGRYVAFLDSDDSWLPGVAPDLLALLERRPEVDVVFTDARVGNDQDGYRSLVEARGAERLVGLSGRAAGGGGRVFDVVPFFRLLTEFNWIFFGAAIVRREAFARSGGFDPGLNQAEDWDVCLRMAASSTFAYWPQPLAVYHTHPGERLSVNRDRMTRGFVQALRGARDRCADLAAAERRLVRSRLRDEMFGYAYLAYNRGDWAAARDRFAWQLRESGPDAAALAYWLLCLCPAWLRGGLRRLIRFARGPLGRAS
jgi:glycosyltransferase involved in cell wall biosynthesis